MASISPSPYLLSQSCVSAKRLGVVPVGGLLLDDLDAGMVGQVLGQALLAQQLCRCAQRAVDETDLGLLTDGVDEHLALALAELDVVGADEADDLGALADAVVGGEDRDAGLVGLEMTGTMPSTSLGVTMMASFSWAMNCWMTATSVARSPLPFWRSRFDAVAGARRPPGP